MAGRVAATVAAMGLLMLACDEDETISGPTIPSASQLVGHWQIVRVTQSLSERAGASTYNWDTTEYVTDTSELYDFTTSNLTYLSYSPGDDCYDDSWTGSYSLGSDGTVLGEDWTGSGTLYECPGTWRTSVSMSNSQLVVTYHEAEACSTTYSYAYTYTEYCVAYGGAWLPPGWPTVACVAKAQLSDKRPRKFKR
jgi:hypothetical protein